MLTPIDISTCYSVLPQIDVADLDELKRLGFEVIINNRPEGESDDQPKGDDFARKAQELGLVYLENPVVLANLTQAEVDVQRMACISGKKVMGFCRTGTRSSVLWVLMQAQAGLSFAELVNEVESRGIDLQRCMPVMQALQKG